MLELCNDQTIAGLNTSGTETGNAVIGGTAIKSTLTVDGDGSFAGVLGSGVPGGNGTDADNLALEVASGTLIVTGDNNTYSRGTTIDSAGTLQLGDAHATGSLGSGNVTDFGSLVFDCGGDAAVGNAISGTGGSPRRVPTRLRSS